MPPEHRSGVVLVEPSGQGGVWEYTCLLARALAQFTTVRIVTAQDFDRHFVDSSVEVETPIVWHRARAAAEPMVLGLVRRIGNAARYLRGLLLSAPGAPFNVVHFQGEYWPPLVVLTVSWARHLGLRFVYTPHNVFSRKRTSLQRWVWRQWQRLLAGRADAVIVHTEHDRQAYRNTISQSVRVLVIRHGPTGVGERIPACGESRNTLGLDPDGDWVLLFGNMRPDKGIDELLAALPDLRALRPRARILIAGDDRDRVGTSAVATLAPELREMVEFRPGFVPTERVGYFFSACRVVCLPYRRAGDSGVARRAVSFGCRLVAYDAGGLREALARSQVHWVKIGDRGQLAHELAQAIDEAALPVPAEPVSDVEDWSLIASETAALYRQVVEAS